MAQARAKLLPGADSAPVQATVIAPSPPDALNDQEKAVVWLLRSARAMATSRELGGGSTVRPVVKVAVVLPLSEVMAVAVWMSMTPWSGVGTRIVALPANRRRGSDWTTIGLGARTVGGAGGARVTRI
jgi:hypothetical protein